MILTDGKGKFMALTLVLSIGLDAELLSTRNLVLRSAGYTVVAAISLKEAIDRFQDGDFDLVLLCHSVPTKEKDRLTCWIRASGSHVPVVSVSGSPCQRDTFTDATVESDPNSLLEGMRKALIKAEMPAARVSKFQDKQQLDATEGNNRQNRPPAMNSRRKPLRNTSPLSRAG